MVLLLWLTLSVVLLESCLLPGRKPRDRTCLLQGIVRDERGPVPGAVVRIQATAASTVTDPKGRFSFSDLICDEVVPLTAWAPGYYISGGEQYQPGSFDAEIFLTAHTDRDNPRYAWLPSTFHPGEGENQGCAECHSKIGTSYPFALPVDEWLSDAHGQSAANPRFLSMYLGTDLQGRKSPLTRFRHSRDYGRIPLPPDLSRPYHGPGYKLDFPQSAGNCAACHVPLPAVNDPYGVDPTLVEAAEGISCDFCHKIWGVKLDLHSGLPADNMPGVLSFEFLRPEAGHQLFMGPFDDVAPGEDTFLPLQRQSQFCAPCHFGVFWDTIIYNSFGEWLNSPYSNPVHGQTCQDCHMPKRGVQYFARPDKGGLRRDPATISSHLMPGAVDRELLRNALTMNVAVTRDHDSIVVTVELWNDRTGHHVPTDSPLRHLILLVQSGNARGQRLQQIAGPTLPDWTGDDYAGLPGQVYAKILEELWTETSPTAAYWNQTRIVADNRIAAGEKAESRYVFLTQRKIPIDIEVRLIYRRAFRELMQQKGWDDPDIIMERFSTRVY